MSIMKTEQAEPLLYSDDPTVQYDEELDVNWEEEQEISYYTTPVLRSALLMVIIGVVGCILPVVAGW